MRRCEIKSVFAHVLFYIFIVDLCVVFGKRTFVTYPEIVTRATEFIPKVQAKTCLLKPDEGPCRADITMYYFDPASMACSTFQWGGCQGNGNRFDTRAECMSYCITVQNQKPTRPKYCKLSFDYGFCFGDLERWYYDHLWKVCKKTLYSGCGGNKNNFYSMEQCEAVCLFAMGPIPEASTQKDGKKKVLIINPWDTTQRRGREQASTTASTNATTTTKKA